MRALDDRPTPPSPSRLAAAKQVAALARRDLPQLSGPQKNSSENSNFVPEFFNASRLHFIGSWKERFQKLLDTLPAPPALPPPHNSQRIIAHIDMDCFFASVAARGRPELDGIALAVAWSGNERGAAEIASCSYVARAYGVSNGMWVARAKELCDHLVVMPYEFEKYQTCADAMYRAVFEITPHVMGVSVDECFADVSASGDAADAASALVAVVALSAAAPSCPRSLPRSSALRWLRCARRELCAVSARVSRPVVKVE